MAECILLKAGSGADLDLVTAGAGDVLSPKVIVDKDGNPITGTLVLSGDAAVGDVLAGKTFYSNDAKTKRTGTMVNQGAKTAALNCGGSYAIPAGYHNGSGKVTANSLSSQTSATAAAGDILTGKTAYVNGAKLTGTMQSLAGGTYTPKAAQQIISCSGKKMTGNITIAGDADLVAGNILNGKNIFGVAGNVRKYAYKTLTVTSSSSASKFYKSGGTNTLSRYALTGTIGFTPLFIRAFRDDSTYGLETVTSHSTNLSTLITYTPSSYDSNSATLWWMEGNKSPAYVNSTGFCIPVARGGSAYTVQIFGYY